MATLKDPVTGRHTMGMAAKNDFTVNSRLKVGGSAGTVVAPFVRNTTRTAIAIAADDLATITVPQFLGGFIVCTGAAGGSRDLNLPTAALFESLSDIDIGDTFTCEIVNTSTSTVQITVGAGGTLLATPFEIVTNTHGVVSIRFNTATTYEAWVKLGPVS